MGHPHRNALNAVKKLFIASIVSLSNNVAVFKRQP